MNRRNFLRNSILGSSVIALNAGKVYAAETQKTLSAENEVLPNVAQRQFMNLKLGMFICYGINTYYDKEWSDGTLDKSIVNPVELDTDQWCRAAKEAGMRYVLFTTKHHDGFCNWDTKFTDYSITHTPFKRDIVAELRKSADKYGLKLGLYYSLWDLHEKSHNENEHLYAQYMENQLNELLSNYGEIVQIWFDGFWKKQRHGWETKSNTIKGDEIGSVESKGREERFINAWRMEGAFRWEMDRIYQFIKSKQPNCMVINNATTAYKAVPLFPVDSRCAEKGHELSSDRKIWNWLGKDVYLPLQIETTLSVKGDDLFPSGNWFWHDWDHSIADKKDVLQWIEGAKRLDANILLNCGISNKGKLRIEDEQLLYSLAQ